MRRLRYSELVVSVLGIILLVGALAPASAASANISRSYSSSSNIPLGSIVSLDPSNSGYVQSANTTNSGRLLGVALNSQDSLLAVDPSTASGSVQIATSGTVNTLVSTFNGPIAVGDQISPSPFNGIGMKATPGARYVGIAQTAFSNTSAGATSEQVKDKSGKSHTIQLGYVTLAIGIGTNNASGGGGSSTNFLQRLVKSLTGNTISVTRILLSMLIACVSLISLITLIHASVYGSIISIGRNPLAKHAVFRTLTSVTVMALLTIAIAVVTIYYLLR